MCKYREPARFCHSEPLGEESCFTELHFVLFEILRFAQDGIAFMLCGAFTERSRPFRKITVKFAGRRVVAPYKRIEKLQHLYRRHYRLLLRAAADKQPAVDAAIAEIAPVT